MELILENIRCFGKGQRVPVKPLTLLIGENSTGKSTFLATYRLAWDAAWGRGNPDFNEEPFLLGTFDEVAHLSGARSKPAGAFSLGWRLPYSQDRPKRRSTNDATGPVESVEIRATFVKGEAQPMLDRATVSYKDGMYVIVAKVAKRDHEKDEHGIRFGFQGPSGEYEVSYAKGAEPFHAGFIRLQDFPRYFEELVLCWTKENDPNNPDFEAFAGMLGFIVDTSLERPLACSPIRSKPERVYSAMIDAPVPSGGHAPMVLARQLAADNGNGASALKAMLLEFGRECGLFDNLSVKRFSKKVGDPFQVLVSNDSPAFNLADVGYGVSQVLPILVDALVARSKSTFLLQQPEVHLHPRAQAALGTFLARVAHKDRKRFLIETHSDYIVDRVRMDIRDEKTGLTPDDVVILYFDKQGKDVTIHPIHIDRQGNIVDPPEGYRRFFMQEERRFFRA